MRALLEGGASPVVVDKHGRTAFMVARGDKVREVFRVVRGEMGEEAWDWTKANVSLNKVKRERKRRRRGELSEESVAWLRGFGDDWVGPEGFA